MGGSRLGAEAVCRMKNANRPKKVGWHQLGQNGRNCACRF
jgi:hypothetical protein